MSPESSRTDEPCPQCEPVGPSQITLSPVAEATRRSFLQRTAIAAAGLVVPAGALIRVRPVGAADDAKPTSETLVKQLYDSLTPMQREEVCFDWDHTDDRGLLRTHVSNNWHITDEKFNVAGRSSRPTRKR